MHHENAKRVTEAANMHLILAISDTNNDLTYLLVSISYEQTQYTIDTIYSTPSQSSCR